jgi:hypothetical protein
LAFNGRGFCGPERTTGRFHMGWLDKLLGRTKETTESGQETVSSGAERVKEEASGLGDEISGGGEEAGQEARETAEERRPDNPL